MEKLVYSVQDFLELINKIINTIKELVKNMQGIKDNVDKEKAE